MVKKRTVRKRRVARRRKLPLSGFPNSMTVRLKYTTEVQINPTAGSSAAHQFRANGVFDPDATGTGHQPRGFDQWMARYNHAYVIGSKITVTPTPISTSNAIPGAYGIMLNDSLSEFANYTITDDIIESKASGIKGRDWRLGGYIYNQNEKQNTIVKHFSAKKAFGLNVVGNQSYDNTALAGPAEEQIFDVWVGSLGGNDPGLLNLVVSLEYIVVFTEPNFLAQS